MSDARIPEKTDQKVSWLIATLENLDPRDWGPLEIALFLCALSMSMLIGLIVGTILR